MVVKRYRENPKFMQKVDEFVGFFPSWYMNTTKLRTLRLAELDEQILDKFTEDVELAIRHPQALK